MAYIKTLTFKLNQAQNLYVTIWLKFIIMQKSCQNSVFSLVMWTIHKNTVCYCCYFTCWYCYYHWRRRCGRQNFSHFMKNSYFIFQFLILCKKKFITCQADFDELQFHCSQIFKICLSMASTSSNLLHEKSLWNTYVYKNTHIQLNRAINITCSYIIYSDW